MMRRTKVLVFLVTNLADQHGGVLWVTNLLESLSRVDDMDFIVVTSGVADACVANEQFVRSFGFDHVFIPFRKVPAKEKNTAVLSLLRTLSDKYYFLCEREFRGQRHIDARVMEIVRDMRPDLIVVNDIWSAMCFPSAFSVALPSCLITLNNEVAFHRVYRAQGGPTGDGLHQTLERWIYRRCNWIANWRMQRYVSRVFRQCAGIVALARDDLPTRLINRTVHAVLPPLLKESGVRWSFRGNRCVFFVGNIGYFPNRLAVEWICQQFAPELHRLDNQIRISIIGASADQVPGGRQLMNVTLLGHASREEVARHMTADDIFIAPIANNFGAKLKLAECASYGMPFVATRSAMSGLPFLTCVPEFDLDRPADAARLVVQYLNTPDALLDLSHSIVERMRQARAEQVMAWNSFLQRSMTVKRKDCAAEVSGSL